MVFETLRHITRNLSRLFNPVKNYQSNTDNVINRINDTIGIANYKLKCIEGHIRAKTQCCIANDWGFFYIGLCTGNPPHFIACFHALIFTSDIFQQDHLMEA